LNNQKEADIAKALVARIMVGDALAEKEMVERYSRGMIFMLRHRSNNQVLADDLSQETWRIIIEKIRAGDLKNHAKLSAYIVQTAKYQLLMCYRGSYQTKVTSGADVNETADTLDHPQQIAERRDLVKVVRQVVNELKTPRDRDLIKRFYLQEQDKKTICQEFGLSELHFNRVLLRARQRFKQLWQAYLKSDE
jgi:RNA polymerase sigma-70 factor (ECF subfamily)